MARNDGGPAFPVSLKDSESWAGPGASDGMTLRDYLAGQALCNACICNGTAPDWQLQRWFGDRTGIFAHEIAAKQAYEHADAMLAARDAS